MRTTPRYNNTPDWFNSAAAQRPMLVVCARYDALHHRTTTAAAAAAAAVYNCRCHLPPLATTTTNYHQLLPLLPLLLLLLLLLPLLPLLPLLLRTTYMRPWKRYL